MPWGQRTDRRGGCSRGKYIFGAVAREVVDIIECPEGVEHPGRKSSDRAAIPGAQTNEERKITGSK